MLNLTIIFVVSVTDAATRTPYILARTLAIIIIIIIIIYKWYLCEWVDSYTATHINSCTRQILLRINFPELGRECGVHIEISHSFSVALLPNIEYIANGCCRDLFLFQIPHHVCMWESVPHTACVLCGVCTNVFAMVYQLHTISNPIYCTYAVAGRLPYCKSKFSYLPRRNIQLSILSISVGFNSLRLASIVAYRSQSMLIEENRILQVLWT